MVEGILSIACLGTFFLGGLGLFALMLGARKHPWRIFAGTVAYLAICFAGLAVAFVVLVGKGLVEGREELERKFAEVEAGVAAGGQLEVEGRLPEPWTSLNLPMEDGTVLYADSHNLNLSYTGHSADEMGGKYHSLLTAAGWIEENRGTIHGRAFTEYYRDERLLYVAVESDRTGVLVANLSMGRGSGSTLNRVQVLVDTIEFQGRVDCSDGSNPILGGITYLEFGQSQLPVTCTVTLGDVRWPFVVTEPGEVGCDAVDGAAVCEWL